MEINLPRPEFWKNKKILVTGHTGFKGSWLCVLLNYLGAQVYGYALEPPTNPGLFDICGLNTFVQSTIGDIRDLPKLKQCIHDSQAEFIIHMAAQSLVRYSYQNPVETYAVNVMGTVNLLEAIRNEPQIKSVVVVTSDKCYENREWIWGYRENDPMGGFDPYSSSKGCAELVTAAYRNSFFNTGQRPTAIASARAGNVIGGGDWANDRLIPDFFRAIQERKPIIIRNPDAIRPWQHVLEPITGYLVLAEALATDLGNKFSEAWNFGPGDGDVKPVLWIITALSQAWHARMSDNRDSNPQPHEATYLKLDCSKSNAILKWYPQWNIAKTLEKTVEWYKAYERREDMLHVTRLQIKEYFNHCYN